MSKVGYNHPSQANWNYGIWKVDLIDTKQPYCMSYTTRETFGGECRFKTQAEKLGFNIIEIKQVYTGTGTQKITGVSSLLDIEGKEFMELIKEFKTRK